jgi:hypothetical protein
MLASGKEPTPEFLSPEVLNYITGHQLYEE